MLDDKEFLDLLQETVYYYKPEDIKIPVSGLRRKADLIEGEPDFWIPKRVRKPVQLLNINTGEIFTGYIVKRHFLNTQGKDRKKLLRKRDDLEYDAGGERVRLKDGWTIYAPGASIS